MNEDELAEHIATLNMIVAKAERMRDRLIDVDNGNVDLEFKGYGRSNFTSGLASARLNLDLAAYQIGVTG